MEHGTDIYTWSPYFDAFPTIPSASFSSSRISFSCAVHFHSSFILHIFGHFLLLCHIFLPYCHCASHYICAWCRIRLRCHAGERSTAFSDRRGWLAHYYGNSSSSADMGIRFSVNSEGGELKPSSHTQLFPRCDWKVCWSCPGRSPSSHLAAVQFPQYLI